jgi:hypothetical protein
VREHRGIELTSLTVAALAGAVLDLGLSAVLHVRLGRLERKVAAHLSPPPP